MLCDRQRQVEVLAEYFRCCSLATAAVSKEQIEAHTFVVLILSQVYYIYFLSRKFFNSSNNFTKHRPWKIAIESYGHSL